MTPKFNKLPMKKQLLTLVGFILSLLAHGQMAKESIQLKKINCVETDLKTGEKLTKTYSFENGKLISIKTSDIIQYFYYNKDGKLDRTLKENENNYWKELTTYFYDENDNLIKYINKYDEGNKSVTKTVTYKHQGGRIKALTKSSLSNAKFTQSIDYFFKDDKIVNESERNLSDKIINNKRIDYNENDIITYKGLFGDKTIDNYNYDDKKSVMQLLVKNVFGKNYQTIVHLISSQEKEFPLECISDHNLTEFSSSSPSKTGYTKKFTYTTFDYPESYTQIIDKIKTVVTYEYE